MLTISKYIFNIEKENALYIKFCKYLNSKSITHTQYSDSNIYVIEVHGYIDDVDDFKGLVPLK